MIVRFLVAFFALAASVATSHAQSPARPPVVVELYTAQGCRQCVLANRLLGELSREPDLIALTLPVGYWDYLGWRDTFALPEFSDRQRAYSRALRVRGRFTPQLVLNGARQVSASDWDTAHAAIDQVRAMPPVAGAPAISIVRLANRRVRVAIGAGAHTSADIWLVAYDPGPLTVRITGGENNNRLVTHYNLVRSVQRIDGWTGSATWFERARCTPQCAVLLQAPNGGRVLAAAATRPAARS